MDQGLGVQPLLVVMQEQLDIVSQLIHHTSAFSERLVTNVTVEEVRDFFEARQNLFDQVQNMNERFEQLEIGDKEKFYFSGRGSGRVFPSEILEEISQNKAKLKEDYERLIELDHNLINKLQTSLEASKLDLYRINSWKSTRSWIVKRSSPASTPGPSGMP